MLNKLSTWIFPTFFTLAVIVGYLPLVAPSLVLPAVIGVLALALSSVLGVSWNVRLVAVAVMVGISSVVFAQGADAAPAPLFDFGAFVKNLLDAGLWALSSSVTVGLVTTVADFVTTKIPLLRPFRDAIVQYVLNARDGLKQDRVNRIVLATGQAASAGLIDKSERRDVAIDTILAQGIAKTPEAASTHLEASVGAFKSKGVNP
jgi:hypothetical protein